MNLEDAWLTTYTGKKFYPFNPYPPDIDIRDIAHGLALTCRYSGQCAKFYSVAEHSVRLAKIVPMKYRMAALLHDSAEAYLTDMPKMLKIALSNYEILERDLLHNILLRFNVPQELIPPLKKYENALMASECRDLMTSTEGWVLPERPLDIIIIPSPPRVAEREYVLAYHLLKENNAKPK